MRIANSRVSFVCVCILAHCYNQGWSNENVIFNAIGYFIKIGTMDYRVYISLLFAIKAHQNNIGKILEDSLDSKSFAVFISEAPYRQCILQKKICNSATAQVSPDVYFLQVISILMPIDLHNAKLWILGRLLLSKRKCSNWRIHVLSVKFIKFWYFKKFQSISGPSPGFRDRKSFPQQFLE